GAIDCPGDEVPRARDGSLLLPQEALSLDGLASVPGDLHPVLVRKNDGARGAQRKLDVPRRGVELERPPPDARGLTRLFQVDERTLDARNAGPFIAFLPRLAGEVGELDAVSSLGVPDRPGRVPAGHRQIALSDGERTSQVVDIVDAEH